MARAGHGKRSGQGKKDGVNWVSVASDSTV